MRIPGRSLFDSVASPGSQSGSSPTSDHTLEKWNINAVAVRDQDLGPDTLHLAMSEESSLQRLIQLQRKLLPIRWDIDELRERMKLVESQAMVSIAEARDERGSPLYSTQEVRRAAVTAKLAENREYSSLQERRRQLQREAEVLALDIKQLSAELGMFPPY